MKLFKFAIVVSLICLCATRGETAEPSGILKHFGCCDASAAVALNRNLMVVADDEDSVLRVYNRRQAGFPLQKFDLTEFMDAGEKHSEVDLEGGTQLGEFVFWISSHGTNRDGKARPARHRLFATRFRLSGSHVTATTVGEPYRLLLDDLEAAPELKKYDFHRAAKRPPKSNDALSIEGLAATPQGTLLIGFRNPVPHGRALLVPLLNPRKILDGSTRARLGAPIEIDLQGYGIRDIEYCPSRKLYVIAGGPFDSGPGKIFTWSGNAKESPRQTLDIAENHWRVEAILIDKESNPDEVQVLSDDGTFSQNADIEDRALGSFRSGWVPVQ